MRGHLGRSNGPGADIRNRDEESCVDADAAPAALYAARSKRLSAEQSLRCSMRNLTTIEIKAFVPAKDFQLAKKFYQDLGFTVSWSSDDLAYICHGNTSFL